MRTDQLFLAIIGLLVLFLAGCAEPISVDFTLPGKQVEVIEMTATSFDFEPAVIVARQTDLSLVIKVTNEAGMDHNFTIEDPGGKTVLSQDLPEGQTVRVDLLLAKTGVYTFFCDKPMHPLFGMKGKIHVKP